MSDRASFECRGWTVDERIVAGIAVPYGETSFATPDPAGERFMPGSLSRSVRAKKDRLKLFRNHDHTVAIGKLVKVDPAHESNGLFAEWRIFNTPDGDAALTEIAEGALDMFSIGFRAIKAARAADGVREIREAEIHEVSLLPLAAYDGARVLAVRGYGADDITKWLDEHRIPPTVATFPELRRYSHR